MRKRALDYLALDGGPNPEADAEEFALRPLVDKIAYGIVRGLIVAVKELEHHIASETRKVGDSVDRRFETLQPTLEELSKFVVEQRATNLAVQERLHELKTDLRETENRQAFGLDELRAESRGASAALSQRIDASNTSLQQAEARQKTDVETLRGETKAVADSVSERIESTAAALREADARQAENLAELQQETRRFSKSVTERIDTLCKDLDIHQEDIAALKTTLCTFSSRVDTLVERLDRQADAVRSMAAAYSQRENELGQLVDGLARLRAYPTPLPASSL
ncbi:MAG TPA: hypothetical protein VGF59_16610 [Bryobacteraceae bacterium]